jgi:periplasmic protein TonB
MDILASTVAHSVIGPAIGGALVYRKSSRGVVKLSAIDGGQLSPLERQLLIMVDGRRTLAELSGIFGSDKLKLLSLLADLEAKGLVKRVDPGVALGLAGTITQLGAPLPGAPPLRGTRDVGPCLDAAPAPGLRPARGATPARFFPPAVIDPARPALAPPGRFSVDENPLAWLALALMLTIACTGWLSNRLRSELGHTWWSDYRQARLVDGRGGLETTDATGGGRFDPPSPIRTAPGPRSAIASPAVGASRPASSPAAHAASRIAPNGHRAATAGAAVARTPPPAPSVAQISAAETDTPATTAPDIANRAPDVDIASAQPSKQTSDAIELRPLRQDPPRIPEKAVHEGVVDGHVQVRLWITPEGKVDQVDVLEASPPGVLDDEVKRALSLWTFEPPGHPIDEVVQLTLKP